MKDLADWTPCERPTADPMLGTHIAIRPYNGAEDANALWQAFEGPKSNELMFHFGWPHLENGNDIHGVLAPLNDTGEYVTCIFTQPDSAEVIGMASYMAIRAADGSVEVGCVAHGPAMARSKASTEVHYLMARRAFDELGYRRYEWKLNNPNIASHNAARRFGFTFEGVFRQHMVKPYGNRDTAWYSMLDSEWPKAKMAFEKWLASDNFDDDGTQRQTLSAIRQAL